MSDGTVHIRTDYGHGAGIRRLIGSRIGLEVGKSFIDLSARES